MFQDIGQRIRTIRTQKGIGLNEFAKMLEVSPGYLSNLETGKTDTIQFSLLQKIQDELVVLPMDMEQNEESNFDFRLKRAQQQLKELGTQNEQGADFLLSTLENGIDWFLNKKL